MKACSECGSTEHYAKGMCRRCYWREHNRRRLQDPQYQQRERERNRRRRQDPQYRQWKREYDRERNRRRQQDPQYRERHRERNRERMLCRYHEDPVESWFYGKCKRIARAAVEERIGRKLRRGEEVHHINGRIWDNSDENLQLCASHAEHMALHRMEVAND